MFILLRSVIIFRFGFVGHTVSEVADELTQPARAVLRMLGAESSSLRTFSVKGYLYVHVTRSSNSISSFLPEAVRL